jgi:hypothetical protein
MAMPKSKRSKTHFEQVPLEIVKKIAEEEIPDDEASESDAVVETPKKGVRRISEVSSQRG